MQQKCAWSRENSKKRHEQRERGWLVRFLQEKKQERKKSRRQQSVVQGSGEETHDTNGRNGT